MLRKDLPKLVIELLSAQRSQRLYVQLIKLESPEVRDPSRPESCRAEPVPLTQLATTRPSPNSKRGDNSLTGAPADTGHAAHASYDQLLPLLYVWLNLSDIFLALGQIFRAAGIVTGSKQTRLKNLGIRLGVIQEHRLQVNKTHVAVLEPTAKAYELVGKVRPQLPSKGGYLHQFIAHHVKEHALQQGYQVDVEFMLSNGKAVDLILRKGSEIIFVEIAVSPPLAKELENCVKDLSTDLQPDKLVILARDKKDRFELESLVFGDNRLVRYCDKIQVSLAGNFITTGGKTHARK